MNKTLIQKSERIYDFVLKFYPKNYRQEFGEEMKFVFSESLKDAYKQNGEHGLLTIWVRTVLDIGKSLFTQHIENQKGGVTMKTKRTDIVMQNKIFSWIAFGTGLVLLIPYFLTIRDGGVEGVGWNWTFSDYVIMGSLIFGFSSLFVLLARRTRKHRLLIGAVVALVFLWLWVELAVGLFTNWGS